MTVLNTSFDLELMRALLQEADQDPTIQGYVYPDDDGRQRLPIIAEGRLVGFATPRQDPDGVWRMGAIYVRPEYRGRGLAARAIRDFMTQRQGRAFIENENIASQRTYQAAGFRLVRQAPEQGGAWWQNF